MGDRHAGHVNDVGSLDRERDPAASVVVAAEQQLSPVGSAGNRRHYRHDHRASRTAARVLGAADRPPVH
jgi:hypothetical protein